MPVRNPFVALDADRDAGQEVQHGDEWLLPGEFRPGPFTDQLAGFGVVGGEQRIGGILRICR
jgi:hypothetical protein